MYREHHVCASRPAWDISNQHASNASSAEEVTMSQRDLSDGMHRSVFQVDLE